MNIFSAIGLLFVALKLLNQVDWSWWVVLAPIYGQFVFFVVFIILAVLFPVYFIDIKRRK